MTTEIATTDRPPLLDVEDLTVEFATRRGTVRAVQHVTVAVAKGETVGIVGESGSGKSVTSYAVMRILDRAGRIAEGSITFGGVDVRNAPEAEVRDLRGREISMIFQNPRAALNPIRKVGKQIEDVLLEHVQAVPADVKEKAIEALRRVRIAHPEERYHAYPFELSGGMCQRVVIALALACQPQLLIADEPTTGLDVTTQKAVMDLVVELTRERGMSTILITHDLGLAAAYCDRVVVMEKGKVVETAPSRQIFAAPEHPYTQEADAGDAAPRHRAARSPAGGCRPHADARRRRRSAAGDAASRRQGPRQGIPAQRGADLAREAVRPQGRGGGKAVPRRRRHQLRGQARRERRPRRRIRLRQVDDLDDGDAADRQDERQHHVRRRGHRRDPGQGIRRAAGAQAHPDGVPGPDRQPQSALHRGARHRRSADAARRPRTAATRCGRNARSSRARSACRSSCSTASRISSPAARRRASASPARSRSKPELVILDEPTAALDVSVQAVVLNLLADLKAELGMSYLFVSHDLNVVRLLCDRVIVMRAGQIVEQGTRARCSARRKTEYTRELAGGDPATAALNGRAGCSGPRR